MAKRSEITPSSEDDLGDVAAPEKDAPEKYYNPSSRLSALLFLRGVALAYFFALLSIFWELPGTFLKTGLLPASPFMKRVADGRLDQDLLSKMSSMPTLLWFVWPDKNGDVLIDMSFDLALTIIVVAGLCLSILIMFLPGHGSSYTVGLAYRTMFLMLWICYLSVYQVGQDFLSFQWDILLLEIGFMCLFLTPLESTQTTTEMGMVLLRCFFFRFMFASGVVKLRSECPTWWGLTALNYHYETTCLPAAGSWWFHQLPDTFQQFSVLMTYAIECVFTFMFLLPSRRLRIFSGVWQVILMILIALSGNYNFFNYVTVVICFCAFDDEFLRKFVPKRWANKVLGLDPNIEHVSIKQSRFVRSLAALFDILVIIASIGFCIHYVLISWDADAGWADLHKISFKLAFSKSQFKRFIRYSVLAGLGLGTVHFVMCLSWSMFRHYEKGLRGLIRLVTTVVILGLECMVLAVGVVPFVNQLDRNGISLLTPPQIQQFYQTTRPFHITSSYGLFSRMTTERREIIYEGTSKHPSVDEWKAYKFRYKPQDLDETLPYISPHQPRLDWQMWFAALRTYQNYPVTVHVGARLLTNSSEVLELMDPTVNPFPKEPPKYVRAISYLYKFTKIESFPKSLDELPKDYWTRSDPKEYIPPLSISEPTLQRFLEHYGWDETLRAVPEDGVVMEIAQRVREFAVYLLRSSTAIMFSCVICLICYVLDNARYREAPVGKVKTE